MTKHAKLTHEFVVSFQTVQFNEPETNRPVVLLYALTDNGVLYECNQGHWIAIPIDEAHSLPRQTSFPDDGTLQSGNQGRSPAPIYRSDPTEKP